MPSLPFTRRPTRPESTSKRSSCSGWTWSGPVRQPGAPIQSTWSSSPSVSCEVSRKTVRNRVAGFHSSSPAFGIGTAFLDWVGSVGERGFGPLAAARITAQADRQPICLVLAEDGGDGLAVPALGGLQVARQQLALLGARIGLERPLEPLGGQPLAQSTACALGPAVFRGGAGVPERRP